MNNQIQQRIDRLKSYGQSLAGANVAYREGLGDDLFWSNRQTVWYDES